MEKFSTKTLFMVGLMAATLLSSCSRQVASTASVSKKMLYSDQLASIKTPLISKTAPCLPVIAEANASNDLSIVSTNIQEKNTATSLRFKDASKKFTHYLPTAIVHKIQSQTAQVKGMIKNHDIASYSSSSHTEGMLGIAGLCLIAAIALAVFGVTNMGVVFWEIAAVLFIAAIVFFVLYLVAKAAGPSTP